MISSGGLLTDKKKRKLPIRSKTDPPLSSLGCSSFEFYLKQLRWSKTRNNNEVNCEESGVHLMSSVHPNLQK